MAEQKKKEKATKIKKKNWHTILAPKIFRNVVLGETLIAESKSALNKTITQNLTNLTYDIKKQNVNIKFIVDKVEGNKAYTSIIGYSMIPASIKRLTRRRSKKIELSFVCTTSDNKKIRVKPLIFARSLTKGSVTSKLNKTIIEYLTRTISKMTFDNLINDLINHKLQSSLRERLKKIYPLRIVEIKSMEIEKEKKPLEEKKVEKIEEKKEIKEEKVEKKEEVKEKPKVEKKEEKVKEEEEKKEKKEEKKEEPKKEEKNKEEPEKEVKEEKIKKEIEEEK